MTRDPKKLKEHRERYERKLEKLGIKRIGAAITRKYHKCKLGFSKIEIRVMVKGVKRKYYHQECWDGMQY